jgi:hypothetical protein
MDPLISTPVAQGGTLTAVTFASNSDAILTGDSMGRVTVHLLANMADYTGQSAEEQVQHLTHDCLCVCVCVCVFVCVKIHLYNVFYIIYINILVANLSLLYNKYFGSKFIAFAHIQQGRRVMSSLQKTK